MPTHDSTIDSIVSEAIADAIHQIAPALQRHIAQLAADQLDAALAVSPRGAVRTRRAAARNGRRRRAREELTKWVADRTARRVPHFVIEMTGGLDTKKKIVAKFGEGVTFEKGKPLPPVKKAA